MACTFFMTAVGKPLWNFPWAKVYSLKNRGSPSACSCFWNPSSLSDTWGVLTLMPTPCSALPPPSLPRRAPPMAKQQIQAAQPNPPLPQEGEQPQVKPCPVHSCSLFSTLRTSSQCLTLTETPPQDSTFLSWWILVTYPNSNNTNTEERDLLLGSLLTHSKEFAQCLSSPTSLYFFVVFGEK